MAFVPGYAPTMKQQAVKAAPASPSDAAERLRVQELLRYFQPPNPSHENKKPQVALDTSLTAYAQLCALKLNCQRSFISLIDRERQYIIAEATRTVSLVSADVHDGDDDALYLGSTTLNINFGVCPDTIKFFTATDTSLNIDAPYIKANQSYYVMNDMSKIPHLECRPYIIGWPNMRYYAEVPIHSPSGLTIGCICVVDNKPRDKVDIKHMEALEEIAHAVMSHLELVTSKVQRQRAERMIQGLGLFVEGSDSLRQWWIDSETNHPTIDSRRRRLTLQQQADEEFGRHKSSLSDSQKSRNSDLGLESIQQTSPDPYAVEHSSVESPSGISAEPIDSEHGRGLRAAPTFNSTTSERQIASVFSEEPAFENIPAPNSSIEKQSKGSESPREDSAPPKVQRPLPRSELEEMLSRASNLIREAIGLDGVMSLDPRGRSGTSHIRQNSRVSMRSPITEERLSPLSRPITRTRTPSNLADPDRPPMNSSTSPILQDSVCKVLACSTRGEIDGVDASAHPLAISYNTLLRITQRFPRGGVLKFDDEGLVSCNELQLAWYDPFPRGQEHMNISGAGSAHVADSDVSCSAVALELSRILPSVQSVILFPLWTASRDKLLAYNIAWTTDPSRAFQREDFAYLASFRNSIMAELSRIDTLAADRAKADFISSISHELRSPLHGVLASAELLKALTKDAACLDIINTIDACGSTLLDTMENLLAFAKINNFNLNQQQKKPKITLSRPEEGLLQPLKSLTTEVDLGVLVEEVMNANISGHQFRKNLEFQQSHNTRPADQETSSNELDDKVMVICDISPRKKWLFNSEAGVWKRILMNLLGNSLKYTSSGYIHVKLSQPEGDIACQGPLRSLIELSVEDSGAGISEEYLKHHLYKPFKQEDPLCPGVGLGLSIVRQLVTSINGSIEINSDVGYGTSVRISAWLEQPHESINLVTSPIIKPETISELKGHRLGLVALDVYPDIRETPTGVLSRKSKRSVVLKSALAPAIESFGLETVTLASLESDLADVDILMTTESHFMSMYSATNQTTRKPIIILCANLALDYRSISYANGPVIYLSQPYGPQKLERALESCIQFFDRPAVAEASSNETLNRPLPTHFAVDGDPKIFPQNLAKPPLSPPPAIADKSESSPVTADRPRVLVVEDNPINLKLLVTYIGKLGCPLATANDGLQAVKTYQEADGAFDLIFMDIQMPNMDGMAASYEIRKMEQENSLSRTMIIALTGLASADAQEQAVLSGIDLFLTKPVPLKSIRAVIEEWSPYIKNGF